MMKRTVPLFLASMKVILTVFVFSTPIYAQIAIEWQIKLGGSGLDEATSIQETKDGGFIVGGSSASNDGYVSGNHGAWDYWVVKLDSIGNPSWQRSLGGSAWDKAYSIQETTDSGFIMAGYSESNNGDVSGNHGSSDYWIIKLDSLGNTSWQKSLGGSGLDEAFSIQETMGGGFIVAGRSNSNDGDVSGNHGVVDYWVVRLDAIGNLMWQSSLGGSDFDYAASIEEVSDGGFIVAGESLSNDGDVTGNHGDWDCWVVKLDFSGNLDWQKSLGGSDEDLAESIQETNDGGFILIGSTLSNDGDVNGNHGLVDYWVVKLDSAGNLIWQNCLGGSSVEMGFSIQETKGGGFIVAGHSGSSDGDVSGNHGVVDYWMVKLDSAGNLVWQNCLGGSRLDRAFSIKETTGGGVIVAGYSASSDGDVLDNFGTWAYWIVKFTSDFAQMNGKVFADLNIDDIQSLGESGLGNYAVNNLNSGANTWSDQSGAFSLISTDTGTTVIAPDQLPYYSANPVNHSAYFDSLVQQVDSLNDFAMQPNGVFNDLCVTISPLGFYRPGFSCQYSIDYANVGTTTLTPTLVFFPDQLLAFDSASTTPTSIAADSVVWQLPALAPFQTGQIRAHLTVDVNAGLGTSLNSWVRIEQLIGDANVGNNSETWSVTTQGSYDPNDILVDQESILFQNMSPVPPDLTYLIRFQNTGTDTAFTVRIENDVPENVDLSTFQFEASSHPVSINYLQHTDRMEYRFDNILLPDSNTNEPLSHGYIRYRIKPKSTLIVGDSVLNDARIYFDFNAPIETNTAITVIETSTSVDEFTTNEVLISPNPTNGGVFITLPATDQGQIQVFDANGKLLVKETFSGIQTSLQLNELPAGLYTISIQGEKSSWENKIMKQ